MSRTKHHNKKVRPKLCYNWLSNEPKSWRHLNKHKKRRAEVRMLERLAVSVDTEELIWPLDVKPWVYYW